MFNCYVSYAMLSACLLLGMLLLCCFISICVMLWLCCVVVMCLTYAYGVCFDCVIVVLYGYVVCYVF